MTEIEKIKRYVDKYGAPRDPHYDMGMKEAFAIVHELTGIEAAHLAFSYGHAKGYRAAKKEAQGNDR